MIREVHLHATHPELHAALIVMRQCVHDSRDAAEQCARLLNHLHPGPSEPKPGNRADALDQNGRFGDEEHASVFFGPRDYPAPNDFELLPISELARVIDVLESAGFSVSAQHDYADPHVHLGLASTTEILDNLMGTCWHDEHPAAFEYIAATNDDTGGN